MTYKTNWKDFLQYDEHGRRVRDWPSIVVETGPNEKNYMYKGEYEAMLAAEKAVKNAARAARQAELAAGRPNSINSDVTPDSSLPASEPRASLPPGSRVPDRARHSRKCLVCSHPDRDAIEGEFIRWRSPHKIARDYGVADRNSIYRHAHATDLFAERRRHVARVLESYLETIDDNPPEDFDPVTRAVRVYAHLNTHGGWVEPRRVVHILSSRIDSGPDPRDPDPGSDFDPGFDPNPEPHLHLDPSDHPPTFDHPSPNDGFNGSQLENEISEVPEGRHNVSPACSEAECREHERHQPPTYGACPPRRANPSAAPHARASKNASPWSRLPAMAGRMQPATSKEFRSAERENSTKVSGFVLTNPELKNVAAAGRSNRHNSNANFRRNNCKQRRSQNLIVTKLPFSLRRTFA